MSDIREVLAELATNPPFIPELHADDCDDTSCVRCVDQPQIAALDVPLPVVEQQAESCAVLAAALEATHSPSDALAYQLDLYLVTHPDTPVSTDADYPSWAAALADRIAKNTGGQA